MDKKAIIKKMMAKKPAYEEELDRAAEDMAEEEGEGDGVKITAKIEKPTEEPEMEEDDGEPVQDIKLTIGNEVLEGQDLVDYVDEHRDEIVKNATRRSSRMKSVIDEMGM